MRATDVVLPVALAALVAGCGLSPSARLEANKTLVRQFTETVNAADWARLEDLVADDVVRHSQATAGPPVTSRAAFVELQRTFLVSMPDQRVTIQLLVAEGDKVAALATYTGTQTGPMGDFPITGKAVDAPFLAIFRIADAKIAELWVEWDNLAMLTQLGVFPPPSPTGG